jgi:hypothetical protein
MSKVYFHCVRSTGQRLVVFKSNRFKTIRSEGFQKKLVWRQLSQLFRKLRGREDTLKTRIPTH